MKQGEIWNLENYEVKEHNRYSNVVDKEVIFDFMNREKAITDLFERTKDPDVKQVLRFAMELNNHYRSEAMELFDTLCLAEDQIRTHLAIINKSITNCYL